MPKPGRLSGRAEATAYCFRYAAGNIKGISGSSIPRNETLKKRAPPCISRESSEE
jgi:hypothetical protein